LFGKSPEWKILCLQKPHAEVQGSDQQYAGSEINQDARAAVFYQLAEDRVDSQENEPSADMGDDRIQPESGDLGSGPQSDSAASSVVASTAATHVSAVQRRRPAASNKAHRANPSGTL